MFQEQDEINLRDYLHVMRKWQWMIIAVFVTVVLIATIRTFRQIPIYQATARILIEKKMSDDPFRDRYYWDNWEETNYLETQHKIIKNRPLAKQVLQKLETLNQPVQESPQTEGFSIRGLFTGIPALLGIEEPPLSEEAQKIAQEEQTLDGFLSMITVTPVRESRLVDVSVTSTDREEAAHIANAVVETYIEQTLEAKISASKNAVLWLIEEVEDARKKVAGSKAALQQYKEQHAIISFEERQNIVMQKLSQLSAAVNGAKIERIALEAQYQEIQQYKKAQLETFPQVVANHMIQQLKVDLSKLESELSESKKKYRGKHPAITALRSQISSIRERIDTEITRVISSITREYEMTRAQERELTKALESQKREALKLNQKAIRYGILQQEVESNRWIYNTLLQKMKEMSITERLEASNIRIVDRAAIPNFTIAPRRKRSIMLAMMVGLVMGITLAFFLEYVDNSIKMPEDVTQYLDIPFLGFIPKMSVKALPSSEIQYQTEKMVSLAPRSIVSEAYRSLRTNVTFSALNDASEPFGAGSSLLITSAEPSEGKSCTVTNLGIAMAQSGRKTLIIDCDFRRPIMHQIFDVKNEDGFADLIANFTPHGKIRIKRTGIPNLDLFPCGKTPPNPSELLGSSITKMLIEALGKKYDTILLDSPPINSVTDPVILSRIANGVAVVIRAGETKRDIAQRARDQLRDAGATILGGVINSVDIQKNKYYYYYAYHYPQYYGKNMAIDIVA